MTNPWLSIPLDDYEGHMKSPNVDQLTVLADLFQIALDSSRPRSAAILGVAGGNGLERIDRTITKRIMGVDINQQFLDEVHNRFASLPGLELHRCDLATQKLSLEPVNLVHAALIFEHTGLAHALENALSLVAPGGRFSVVLQLQSAVTPEPAVASTGYSSIQTLKEHFALIDVDAFQQRLREKGFHLIDQTTRSLPGGKALWLGVFTNLAISE